VDQISGLNEQARMQNRHEAVFYKQQSSIIQRRMMAVQNSRSCIFRVLAAWLPSKPNAVKSSQ
jgi:hypothetical protein